MEDLVYAHFKQIKSKITTFTSIAVSLLTVFFDKIKDIHAR